MSINQETITQIIFFVLPIIGLISHIFFLGKVKYHFKFMTDSRITRQIYFGLMIMCGISFFIAIIQSMPFFRKNTWIAWYWPWISFFIEIGVFAIFIKLMESPGTNESANKLWKKIWKYVNVKVPEKPIISNKLLIQMWTYVIYANIIKYVSILLLGLATKPKIEPLYL